MFKKALTLILILFFSYGFAQNPYWESVSENSLSHLDKIDRESIPHSYHLYHLNLEAFKQHLAQAPIRNNVRGKSNFIVEFPTADGTFESYRVTEAPMLPEKLANKYPSIKTYSAVGIDDPTATMRFSITPFGLHTMELSGKKGQSLVDPFTVNQEYYIVYFKRDLPPNEFPLICETESDVILEELDFPPVTSLAVDTDDSTLRTYRLALSCTAEYGNIFANSGTGSPKENILGQMTITINRVNEIFERDLGITLEFVENNDDVIYYGNTSQDPYYGEYNNTTQNLLDNVIGNANYDIGHNFNTSGGGNAGCIGCVCVTGQKGSGMTGSYNPVGDAFDIDYVAHEMGHQFGAYHTMNTCSRSGNGMTEVEIASGSSVMGYAGICPVNVQFNSDAHFNYVNIVNISDSVQDNVSGNCAVETLLENQPPTADAGADYTIPKGTAFVLRGNASDSDGMETLTYSWYQNNPEQAPNNSAPNANWTQGPIYRALLPTDSPDRWLPKLSDVLNGNLTPTWEVTPNVSRSMRFAFVVRDNGSGYAMNIGQTASDLMEVSVDATAGPFKVTSQSATGIVWNAGDTETITWNVANTDGTSINENEVDIVLALDGQNFDLIIAERIPNNGTAQITVPNLPTTQARLMVRASNNIFYAVNSKNFTIQSAEGCDGEITQISISDVEYSTAVVNWESTGTADVWEVIYGEAGFDPYSEGESKMVSGNAETTLSGLFPETDYEVYVRPVCDINIPMDISDNEVFTTGMAPCFTPGNLQVSLSENANGVSGKFTWNLGGYEDQWEIIYGEPGFNPNESGTSIIVDGNPSTVIADLTEDTEYDVYVRALCSENRASDWEGPIDFSTLIYCEPKISSSVEPITLVDFADLYFEASPQVNSSPGYVDNTHLTATLEVGETYSIILKGNTDSSFWGNFTNYFTVFIDWNRNGVLNDTGEIFQIGSITGSNGMDNIQATGTITVPEDANIGKTRMRVYKNYNSSVTNPCANNSFGQVADFSVRIMTDECLMPTNISVIPEGDDAVWVSWTEIGLAQEWLVFYGESGFDPNTEGTSVNISGANGILIENLDPDTDYDVYVMSLCGEGDISPLTDAFTFNIADMSVNNISFEQFSYYPNPVENVLTLESAEPIEQVTVYNLLGQIVKSVDMNQLQTQLNLTHLQSDMYLMKVQINGNTKVFRVIKK